MADTSLFHETILGTGNAHAAFARGTEETEDASMYCDMMADWWPDHFDHPVGYHPTVPCMNNDTSHRTYDQVFATTSSEGETDSAPVLMMYMPLEMRDAHLVHNFFGTLNDIWSTANNALQLKPMETAETGLRAAVNSVFGIYGLIDWGTRLGLQRHNADFGQTLGYWGVPGGPYVVLPLFGSSNLRDTVGLAVDMDQNLWAHVDPTATRYSGTALRVIDKRAEFLGLDRQLDQVALDKYAFIRDAYMQRRKAQTRRGAADKDEGNGPGESGKEERYDQ
jgi:phospholipid-binding lipoprotein MlaA